MSYEIFLYHLVPWQRQVTLVKEDFDVNSRHKGVLALWHHLKNSQNREVRTERLEDDNVIDLVRPIDCEYTLNWVFVTNHINDADKASFAKVLTKMMGDKWLWFGFRKNRK